MSQKQINIKQLEELLQQATYEDDYECTVHADGATPNNAGWIWRTMTVPGLVLSYIQAYNYPAGNPAAAEIDDGPDYVWQLESVDFDIVDDDHWGKSEILDAEIIEIIKYSTQITEIDKSILGTDAELRQQLADLKTFREKFKATMRFRDITQTELAGEIGGGQNTISGWLGGREPSAFSFLRACKYLRVDPYLLID